MNARRIILLAAAALLGTRAGAEGNSGDAQKPPSDSSQSWSQKAQDLGQQGVDAAKKGASTAADKVNEAGQAVNATVTGTKTVTGRIAEVSKDQVTMKGSEGTPLNLHLTGSTEVTVGGQKGSAGQLKQGDEVRATYAQSGGSATATKIEVQKAAGASSPGTAPPGSKTPSGAGTESTTK
jgi:hypothetical protein